MPFGHPHAIVGLEALLTEVDRTTRPMRIAVVDRHEHDILRKYIDLQVVSTKNSTNNPQKHTPF